MLVAFDFDGTLSDSEMTVLLGERNGTAGDMAEITEQAMNDEIEYAESVPSKSKATSIAPMFVDGGFKSRGFARWLSRSGGSGGDPPADSSRSRPHGVGGSPS